MAKKTIEELRKELAEEKKKQKEREAISKKIRERKMLQAQVKQLQRQRKYGRIIKAGRVVGNVVQGLRQEAQKKQQMAKRCPPCPARRISKKSSRRVPIQRERTLRDDLDFFMRL